MNEIALPLNTKTLWPAASLARHSRRRTFRDVPDEPTESSDDVEAGQRVYTPLVLRSYDLFVLGFSNRFVWRCPSSTMLERYDRHIGARHLDIGVGTGWFLDRCKWPVDMPQITLLDLNENSLSKASQRIRRYAPATVRANVLDPVELGERRFDSIERITSSTVFPASSSRRFERLLRTSAPTLRPGRPFREHDPRPRGRAQLPRTASDASVQPKGIFSNVEDDQRGLEEGLASQLTDVETEIVGAVALFAGRRQLAAAPSVEPRWH